MYRFTLPISPHTDRRPRRAVVLSATAITLLLTTACGQSAGTGGPTGTSTLPDNIAKTSTITVGTDASYPPYEFIDPKTHELRGFEVDLMNAIAKKLAVQVRWEFTQFAGLIPGVASGRYDVAIEAMADSLERQKQVSFVNYGYGLPGVLYQASDSTVTDESLSMCGKKIAIQQGTNFLNSAEQLSKHCTDSGKPKIELKTYASAADALLALTSKRVDGNMTSYATGAYQVKQQPEMAIKTYKDVFKPKIWGIAVARDNAKLQQALLSGLTAVIDSGEYKKILDDWNVGDVAIDKPGINLAKE